MIGFFVSISILCIILYIFFFDYFYNKNVFFCLLFMWLVFGVAVIVRSIDRSAVLLLSATKFESTAHITSFHTAWNIITNVNNIEIDWIDATRLILELLHKTNNRFTTNKSQIANQIMALVYGGRFGCWLLVCTKI